MLYFIFVVFCLFCFSYLFFFLTFLCCTGYTCRLNKFSISESEIALAKTLKCYTFTIDRIIVIIITGDSAFIILALTEETSGKFQDEKTYEINEGSYKCVCICICIYLYIYIYILKLHGTENFTIWKNRLWNEFLKKRLVYVLKKKTTSQWVALAFW